MIADSVRVAVLERFLLNRLSPGGRDERVGAAVRAIRATSGSIRIRGLAAELGLSQDRLEKRFRQAVGASPKELAAILRLRRAVDAYRPGVCLARPG